MNDSIYTEKETEGQARQPIGSELPMFAMTDMGNGDRFTNLHAGKIVWVPEIGQWFYWNGLKWEEDETGEKYNGYVREVLYQIQAESMQVHEQYSAIEAKDTEYAKDILKKSQKIGAWCQISQSVDKYFAMGKMASKNPIMSLPYANFDEKGDKFIGVQNGVLHLGKMELRVGDSKYLCTKSMNVEFEPGADCPKWQEFLNTIMQGDEDKIQFLQRLAGQCLIGETKSTLVIFYGPTGANGKSTFVETLMRLLGDYGEKVSTSLILRDGNSKEYYLANLKGKRMVVMNETKVDAHLAEDIIKLLVDSGGIPARKIRGEPFVVKPLFTPILTTNHVPRMSADDALWRRLLVVDFNYQIPKEQRDANYIDKYFVPEFRGILNWCLEGVVMYRKHGLSTPKSVQEYTERVQYDSDMVGQFINQYCTKKGKVKLSTFRSVFKCWAGEAGVGQSGIKVIKEYLVTAGYAVYIDYGNFMYVHGLSFPNIQVEIKNEWYDIERMVHAKIDPIYYLERHVEGASAKGEKVVDIHTRKYPVL